MASEGVGGSRISTRSQTFALPQELTSWTDDERQNYLVKHKLVNTDVEEILPHLILVSGDGILKRVPRFVLFCCRDLLIVWLLQASPVAVGAVVVAVRL